MRLLAALVFAAPFLAACTSLGGESASAGGSSPAIQKLDAESCGVNQSCWLAPSYVGG